jgi:hypothetical protein
MALFGSRKKKTENAPETTTPEAVQDSAADTSETPADMAAVETAPVDEAPRFDRSAGPFDESEKRADDAYIDFGGLLVKAPEGGQIRLDIDQASDTIVAVTVDLGASSLQLQAFSAPKSTGLWAEIREQIRESVAAQGGSSEVIDGEFGSELFVKIPVTSQDGSMGYRSARFLGVDGPRWFVRGVLGGPAATDEKEAAPLADIFRSVVVVRGSEPLPPKELLALRVPHGVQTA